MSMRFFKFFIISLLISSLFFSCKITKSLSKKQSSQLSAIFDSISANYLDYEYLYIKSTLKFKSEKKSIKLKSSIKILKDSIIIVSLSPGLGIEAARIKFTKDSIYIMDRLSSHLTKASYKYLLDSMNISVDYYDIVHILCNELFIYPKDKSLDIRNQFISNYHLRKQNNGLELYRKTVSQIEQSIFVDPNYFITESFVKELNNNRTLQIKFTGLYSDEFKSIPKGISIFSLSDETLVSIELNYTKVLKNKSMKFSFKVPAKYKITVL